MAQPDPSFSALVQLGDFLREFLADASRETSGIADTTREASGNKAFHQLTATMEQARLQNPWFTREEVTYALQQWGDLLRKDRLKKWLAAYDSPSGEPLTVALILAGNVPLVGFHHFISVLLTGNRALVKCSSSDNILLPHLASLLTGFEPSLDGRYRFEDGTLKAYDAVIATGSNNTSRYFEYYFGSRPHIIRMNRSSVAVLTGSESPEELGGLADDIFRYFGLGCRSVSKLFVPDGYDFDPFFTACYAHKHRIDHQKYANNYDYNKAVYLMSGSAMLDNGFLLLKEDPGLGSPIGTLFYETYTSMRELQNRLDALSGDLQCVVGPDTLAGAIPFGQAQQPALDAYADGVDTIAFLQEIPASNPEQ